MTPPGTQTPPHHSVSSASAPGGAAPATPNLDSQIDALLSDAAPPSDVQPGHDSTPSSAAADAEAAVASIEKQVESLVDQFVEHSSTQAAPQETAKVDSALPSPSALSSAPAPTAAIENTVPDSIGELDDQLARLTDELLTAPEPYQAPSVKFAPTPEDQIEPPPPEVVPQPAAASVAAPVTPQIATPKPVAMPATVETNSGPGKLVRVFAKPLAGKPRLIRDTVGWLGFNSMFLAGVVWAYHLWFQRPEKPVAQHAPAALVSSDGHDEPAHGDAPVSGHDTAPADGHANAEHGQPQDAHAKAEHGTDEPITGVNALQKKKPTYALSDAMAQRLNVAKKAEAGHGGGGGGHGAEKKSGSGHGAPAKSGH
ncbi:MAG: hypothetical protein JNK16_09515 [Phycisphaerales bacterium]|nr:hypothetical protein [Phycisphaerales bacterium]